MISYDLTTLIFSLKNFVISFENENEKFYNFDNLLDETKKTMDNYVLLVNENISNTEKLNEINKDHNINPVFKIIEIWFPKFDLFDDEVKNTIVFTIHDLVIRNIILKENMKWSEREKNF